MQEFKVEGKQGLIEIEISKVENETSLFGGHEAKGKITIQSGNFSVASQLWFTTGDVLEFYEQLMNCYQNLEGKAIFNNYESTLHIVVEFNSTNQVNIHGSYREVSHIVNELHFEIESDKNYILSTLDQLRPIVEEYDYS